MSRQADPEIQAFLKQKQIEKENMTDKISAHAQWAPSAAKRNLNCKGSLALSLTVPEPPASEAALEGTKAHDFCERLLRVQTREYSTVSEKERLIKSILKEIDDEEMLEHVKGYSDFVLKVRTNFLKKCDGKFHEFIEEKLHYSKEMFGTIDYGLVAGTSAVVIDLKYGQGVEVEAQDNPQLKCYALCLLKKFPELEKIHFFVYQPRIGDTPHERFDINVSDLKKFGKEVDKSIKESLRIIKDGCDVENLCEGEWCGFCPAFAVCPLKLKAVEEKALSLFEDETPAVIQDLPIDRLVEIWKKKKVITKVLDEVDTVIESFLLSGGTHPDLKLVTISGRRSYKSSVPDDEIIATLKALGLKKPFTTKPIGITESEKQIKKLAKETGKDIGKLMGIYLNLLSPGEDRPGIALSTDNRLEWERNDKAIEMFEDETKTFKSM